MNDIFAPMPPMESLQARIARWPSRIINPEVPRPGHAAFIGPLPLFRDGDNFDPRPNVPGRTYWGD